MLNQVHVCHNVHQDAHEFLSQCLDQLKDDVEKMNKNFTNEAAASSSSSVVGENGQEAMSSASKTEPGEEVDTSRIYTCPVAVNMEFEVQHTIICKGWGPFPAWLTEFILVKYL